jgi:iron complex transport system substrate-binding protein
VAFRALVAAALAVGCGLSLLLGGLAPEPAAGGRGVVCLSPALTEVVCHIGAGERLLGVADFTCHPPWTARLPRLGGAFNPSFEGILALRPGLLIAQGRAARVRAFARRFGIAMPEEPIPLDTLGDLREAYTLVGKALGLPAAAAAARAELDRGLARAAARRPAGAQGPRVLVALGHRPGTLAGLYTATAGTFLGELVAIAGGENVMAGGTGLWPQLSLEQVRAARPEVILELHPATERKLEPLLADWRRALPDLPAVAAGRVHLLTEDHLLLPGPRVRLTAMRLAEIFFPGGK